MTMFKALAALAAFLSVSNAHMIITSPTPMGKSVLNTSPLQADGSDFPCKSGVTGWDNIADGGGNVMTVGEANPLIFQGGATHGGGSCQVSITSDTPPTKNSKWMVLQSIEGNCPAADSTINVSGDASNTQGLSSFKYTIPDHPDIPAGKNYTVAWTWHNKIGNREMYMNCASVQLQAAKKKRYAPVNYKRQSSSLPDMFVANIGSGCSSSGCASSGCSTKETFNVKYPNPGQNLITGPNLADPVGSGCGAAVAGGSSPSDGGSASSAAAPAASSSTGGGFGGSPTASSGPAGGNPNNGGGFATYTGAGGASSPTATGASQVTQSAGGVFATGAASSGAAQNTAAQPTQPAAATSPAPAAATGSSSSGSSSGSNSGSSSGTVLGAQSGACTDEGAWACAADGKSFQRCASGLWSSPMAMAAGTTCTPGGTAAFANVAPGKRSSIHRRRLSGMRREEEEEDEE